MSRTTADPCVLVKRDGDHISSLVSLQVDDSLSVGTEEFMEEEENAAGTFRSKPRMILD